MFSPSCWNNIFLAITLYFFFSISIPFLLHLFSVFLSLIVSFSISFFSFSSFHSLPIFSSILSFGLICFHTPQNRVYGLYGHGMQLLFQTYDDNKNWPQTATDFWCGSTSLVSFSHPLVDHSVTSVARSCICRSFWPCFRTKSSINQMSQMKLCLCAFLISGLMRHALISSVTWQSLINNLQMRDLNGALKGRVSEKRVTDEVDFGE